MRLSLAVIVPLLVACSGGCGGRPGGNAGTDGSPQGAAGEGCLNLTFDLLGAFPVPDPGGELPDPSHAAPAGGGSSDSAPSGSEIVPQGIRDLDGRRVAILGYMMPVDFEAEGTNRFVLLKCTLACCYGKIPRVNEWVDVTVSGGRRVPYRADQPVRVSGRFKVQEDIENGNLVGLYLLQADEVARADKL